MGLMFGCIVITTIGIDAACYSSMSAKLPIYPNARVTLDQHNFLQRFGMGTTVMILDTDDDVEVVRDWYGTTVAKVYKAARETNQAFFYFASARYSVGPAEDGSGTQIILNGACAGG
jgi:F420-0:gamma-glutamyl ligase-like protein